MRKKKTSLKERIVFFIVAILIFAVAALTAFGLQIGDVELKGVKSIRFGIDFKPADENVKPTAEQLDSARTIIETRLDDKNILDRNVTVDTEQGYILVEFPWSSDEENFDPAEAIQELGETAELSFWHVDQDESTMEYKKQSEEALLTGKNVKSAAPVYSEGQYMVSLEFDDKGKELFAAATKAHKNELIGIYMDDTVISAPEVQAEITDGKAVITSPTFTVDEVQDLASKINAGALPFSLTSTNYSSISATLGEGSLNIMINAGIIAFAAICLFLLLYYRLPGFVACINLVLQVSGQLLVFSSLGLTLTLPGIAGIILAIGMSVDSNIIIAENIKDEIRNNKTVKGAVSAGFTRAFSAVLDCNVTTAIIAILLLIFGTGSMLSFGYTLLIGNIMNFCFGIICTKLMLTSLVNFKGLCKPWLCGGKSRKAV